MNPDEWLDQNTFRCEKLRARIRPEACREYARRHADFCGECEEGKRMAWGTCSYCGKEVVIVAQGLCKACYNRMYKLKKKAEKAALAAPDPLPETPPVAPEKLGKIVMEMDENGEFSAEIVPGVEPVDAENHPALEIPKTIPDIHPDHVRFIKPTVTVAPEQPVNVSAMVVPVESEKEVALEERKAIVIKVTVPPEDADLVELLRERARRQRRTVSAEALCLIEEGIGARKWARQE